MSVSEPARTGRTRRQPPPFRQLTVRRVAPRSPYLVAITLDGPELEGLMVEDPAASVRLLLPDTAQHDLVMPRWNGNEFLLPDGRRPAIRTLTPRRVDPRALELDLEVVVHGRGVASAWAQTAQVGDTAGVSGPGRGYTIDRDAPAFLLAGDESAIPAISQLLEALPAGTPAQVYIEVSQPEARLVLPSHPDARVVWCDLAPGRTSGDALVAAVRGADLTPGIKVWVAGEAAAVQRIRRYLFEERQLSRAQATVRGYWKHGRTGEADGE